MKSNTFDWRVQFVSTLKGEHKMPDGKVFPDGAITFLGVDSRWNKKTVVGGPMPSPVALFLSSAINSYNKTLKIKSTFKFNKTEESFTNNTKKFYDYIELYFSSIVFSATALEMFCNVHIDEKDEYRKKTPKNIEVYIGEQIERWIGLDEKLTEIVAKKMGVTIDKSGSIWSNYKILGKMRDRLIHLKNKDRISVNVDDDTVWSFVITEVLFNPCTSAIDLMKLFFDNEPVPEWLLKAEKHISNK